MGRFSLAVAVTSSRCQALDSCIDLAIAFMDRSWPSVAAKSTSSTAQELGRCDLGHEFESPLLTGVAVPASATLAPVAIGRFSHWAPCPAPGAQAWLGSRNGAASTCSFTARYKRTHTARSSRSAVPCLKDARNAYTPSK